MTLSELLNRYLEANRLRPTTEAVYASVVKRLSQYLNTDPDVNKLTQQTLIQFRNELLTQVSAVTWNKYLRHIKALLNYAVFLEVINKNPCHRLTVTEPQKPLKTVQASVILTARTVIQREKNQRGKRGAVAYSSSLAV